MNLTISSPRLERPLRLAVNLTYQVPPLNHRVLLRTQLTLFSRTASVSTNALNTKIPNAQTLS